MSPVLRLDHVVAGGECVTAGELLARLSGLPKARIKDAMNKGAVWLTGGGRGKRKRLHRFTAQLRTGDRLQLYYDAHLLARVPPAPQCRQDLGRYSVWFKPADLLAQGNDYGDHCSLLRQAELYFTPRRPVFLVHRLDQAAQGLMLVAHDRATAAALSGLFRDGGMEKTYQVVVHGDPGPVGSGGTVDLPLDGKSARTHWRVERCDGERRWAWLRVHIDSGRLHQIRRHLCHAGWPVVGDKKYGVADDPQPMLHLAASGLAFVCPVSGQPRSLLLPAAQISWWVEPAS